MICCLPKKCYMVVWTALYSITTFVVADFARVVKHPKAVAVGLTGQMILLPIVGFAIASPNLRSDNERNQTFLADCFLFKRKIATSPAIIDNTAEGSGTLG